MSTISPILELDSLIPWKPVAKFTSIKCLLMLSKVRAVSIIKISRCSSPHWFCWRLLSARVGGESMTVFSSRHKYLNKTEFHNSNDKRCQYYITSVEINFLKEWQNLSMKILSMKLLSREHLFWSDPSIYIRVLLLYVGKRTCPEKAC